MTKDQQKVIQELREEGYAVILFAPEELGEADPRRVQDRSVELGNEVIEELNG